MKWILVTEKLPEYPVKSLWLDNNNWLGCGRYLPDDGHIFMDCGRIYQPREFTYWIELSEIPLPTL
jgi:hypothetical protein